MKNESDYLIRNKQQIINHLNLLIKQKCLITLYFGENESFLTTLVAIDPEKNILIFDYGPKEYLNQRVPHTIEVDFRTVYAGIQVAFEGSKIKKAKHLGEAVFSMPVPETIMWRQRRQFYRVKSPLSKASFLRLTLEDYPPAELKLYDLSITGFSFLYDPDELAGILTLHSEFKDCRLILENTAEDTVSFEIFNIIPLNPNKPDKTKKIGCKFTSITPVFESGIQRYMQQIERENKQRN